ncbi:hypothetical protein D2L64_22560 [Micromonospora radicis]|uniref:GtrA/DPMS transmembrane domain-containing protein n=1 Tax=Micromonospora radicis TaxID=1894971 RepID=A0A418MPL5_9ACTN|nr:hypothetical protein D2L64_22560 [Micromonospora radicis]
MTSSTTGVEMIVPVRNRRTGEVAVAEIKQEYVTGARRHVPLFTLARPEEARRSWQTSQEPHRDDLSVRHGSQKLTSVEQTVTAQFVRFVATGAVTSAVQFGVFLMFFGLGDQVANLAGVVFSSMLANEMHRRVTFQARGRVSWATAQWEGGGLSIVALAATSAALALLDGVVSEAWWARALLIAAVNGLVGVMRFGLLRSWVFPAGSAHRPGPGQPARARTTSTAPARTASVRREAQDPAAPVPRLAHLVSTSPIQPPQFFLVGRDMSHAPNGRRRNPLSGSAKSVTSDQPLHHLGIVPLREERSRSAGGKVRLPINADQPRDAQHRWDRHTMVTADEILASLRPDPVARGTAPAETWLVPGHVDARADRA